MKKSLISFILNPTQISVPLTLMELDAYASKHKNLRYEIILVTEIENKKTRSIVQKFSSLINNLELIVRQPIDQNRTPLQIGITQSRSVWSLIIREEDHTPLQEINKIIAALQYQQQEKPELILSSRYSAGAYTQSPQNKIRQTVETYKTRYLVKSEKNPRFLAVNHHFPKELFEGISLHPKSCLNFLQKTQRAKIQIGQIPVFHTHR